MSNSKLEPEGGKLVHQSLFNSFSANLVIMKHILEGRVYVNVAFFNVFQGSGGLAQYLRLHQMCSGKYHR